MTNLKKDLYVAKTNLNNFIEDEYILDFSATVDDLKQFHLYEYTAIQHNDKKVINYLLIDYSIKSNDNADINKFIISQIFDLYYDMYNQDVFCAELEQIF